MWLDLNSPRLLPLPRREAEGPLPYSVESIRPENSISRAEERRHFAAVREALGLDPAAPEVAGCEGSEAWMARRRTTSSLNSAGFRIPASKKMPLSCLVANCSGLPNVAMRAAQEGLQRSLQATSTASSITQSSHLTTTGDADSIAPLDTTAAGVVERPMGTAHRGDFAVKSRAHFVASPANSGPAPLMIGLGSDAVRNGWTSGGGLFGNGGEGNSAARTLSLSVGLGGC